MFKNFYHIITRSEPFPSLRNAGIALLGYGRFIRQLWQFQHQSTGRKRTSYINLYPQLLDRTANHGFDRHYIYHTAWAARILAKTRPKRHVDISSSLYFSSIVSAFIPVEFFDFRRVHLQLSHLKTGQADATALRFKSNSLPSVSCLHTIEHIGLGRYGDAIDVNGDQKAFQELMRVVSPGGQLLIVVPIAKESAVIFNAHRVYTARDIKAIFANWKLKEFALIPEYSNKGWIINPKASILNSESYACGCFWLIKPR